MITPHSYWRQNENVIGWRYGCSLTGGSDAIATPTLSTLEGMH